MRRALWLVAAGLTIAALAGLFSFDSPPSPQCRVLAAEAQIRAFHAALEMYRKDTSSYPAESQGLQALRTNPGTRGWNGPYLVRDVPFDPWGAPYRYRLTGIRPEVNYST